MDPDPGLIGGPLLIAGAIGRMFDVNDLSSAVSVLGTLPIFVWERQSVCG